MKKLLNSTIVKYRDLFIILTFIYVATMRIDSYIPMQCNCETKNDIALNL